jgi:hypothetical protein
MTHLSPAKAVHAVAPPISHAGSPVAPLIDNGASLQRALARKRAHIAQLEAAWVVAAEADIARHLGQGIRVDNRATWDRTTWDRYLAAATAHEPNFQPRIMRLLREIESLERFLASPVPLERTTSQPAEAGP